MLSICKKTLGSKLAELEKFEDLCWVDLVEPRDDEIERVSSELNVPKEMLKAPLDVDEKPRIEVEDNKEVLCILQVPVKKTKDGALSFDTIPLGVIITRAAVVTICPDHTEIMEAFHSGGVRSFSTGKKTRFLLQIMERTTYYYIKYIGQIERHIKEIEQRIQKSFKNEEIIKLLELQKSLVYFNHAALDNSGILEKTMKGNVMKLFDEDKELLDDIIIENKQAIDTITIASSVLANTMDAYTSIISNNLNIVMKFLTSVTIVLTIPNIVASFYGMNLKLPFQEEPNGFALALLMSFILSSLLAFVFWRKNWF